MRAPQTATTMPVLQRSTPAATASPSGRTAMASRLGPNSRSPSCARPTTSALADAEMKLGLAVLKYGRQARGGRLDPSAISRMFDQKPAVFDPKSLMQAIAATDAVDAYL